MDEARSEGVLEEEGFFEPSGALEDLLDQANEDVLIVLVEDRVDGLVDLDCLTLLSLRLYLFLLLLLSLILHDYLADYRPVLLPIEPRDPLFPQVLEQVNPLPVKLLPREELVVGLVVEVIRECIQGKVTFKLVLDEVSDGLREVGEVCGLALQVLFLLFQGDEVDELVF